MTVISSPLPVFCLIRIHRIFAMNGIFPAVLAVYLLLAPIIAYIFVTHRWAGFLP